MSSYDREIDKELYDKCMECGGHIPAEMQHDFYGEAVMQGYGFYGDRVYEKDGKYFVRFSIGSSCD